MNEIRQLPIEISNQIAAGEVIENPAAVIKELVENSVDSGADKIVVTVERSGKSYISVEDNGSGIAHDQLSKLILRHATSKIRTMDDLLHCRSMGFRGEALASISSVSRFRVRSHTAEQDVAWQLFCEGDSTDDMRIEPFDSPCSVGTVVEVRDLFFRVPARQKFLSSDQAEMRKIKEVVKKMILAHPTVSIELKNADKRVLIADSCTDIASSKERLQSVFGGDFAQSVFYVDQEMAWGRLRGWCAKPSYNRRYADMQVFLLHHRPLRDKKLSFAMKRAYMDVMLPGRHAAFCLYLDMDPLLVDVNVHPAKDEARFSNIDEITRSLKYVISQSLSQLDQVPEDRVDLKSRVSLEVTQTQDPLLRPATLNESRLQLSKSSLNIPSKANSSDIGNARISLNRQASPQSGSMDFKSLPESTHSEISSRVQSRIISERAGLLGGDYDVSDHQSFTSLPSANRENGQSHVAKELLDEAVSSSVCVLERDDDVAEAIKSQTGFEKREHSHVVSDAQPKKNAKTSLDISSLTEFTDSSSLLVAQDEGLTLGYALGQLHGIYVLAQSQKGLIVVDMHAAHERIVYEQLKSDYARQGVVSQKLLVPFVCQGESIDADFVDEFGLLLSQMGLDFKVEGAEVFLESIPAMLSKKDLNGLIEEIVTELLEYHETDRIQESLHKIFATMACHSAIRANRVLSLTEMNELLRQIEKTANSDYCNHGRPTWFLWDLDRIDAVFRRGQ